MKHIFFASAMALSWAAISATGGDAASIPWRPFPELPTLLWIQDFDHDIPGIPKAQLADAPKSEEADAAKNKVPANAPAKVISPAKGPVASGKAMSFIEANLAGTLQKVSVCSISLTATKLKIPDGQKTTGIIFYGQFWAEEAGEMIITMTTKDGPRDERRPIPAAKTWTPINVRLNEFSGSGGRIKDADVVTEMRFLFRPSVSTTFQKAYVDNLIVTSGAKNIDEILPYVEMALKKAHEMDRVAAKDGFSYSEPSADLMRAALKTDKNKRKNRSVLVFEPNRGEAPLLLKALMASASKAQFSTKFVAATSPDQTPVGGLSDMRMLFRYNIANVDPEFVLLPISAADAQKGDSESIKVLIDRALEAGSIPVVCLPFVPDAEKGRIESFASAVRALCNAKGVTYVEKVAGAKEAEGDGQALLCAKALRHLELYFLRRK